METSWIHGNKLGLLWKQDGFLWKLVRISMEIMY